MNKTVLFTIMNKTVLFTIMNKTVLFFRDTFPIHKMIYNFLCKKILGGLIRYIANKKIYSCFIEYVLVIP